MDAYHTLVIILASTLAVFLVLAIICAIILIKLLNQMRKITAKADNVMDDVEAVSDFFRKTAAPVAIGNLLSNIVKSLSRHKRRGKD